MNITEKSQAGPITVALQTDRMVPVQYIPDGTVGDYLKVAEIIVKPYHTVVMDGLTISDPDNTPVEFRTSATTISVIDNNDNG
jgi:hypothetical protein